MKNHRKRKLSKLRKASAITKELTTPVMAGSEQL
jgi:hypothetical protein